VTVTGSLGTTRDECGRPTHNPQHARGSRRPTVDQQCWWTQNTRNGECHETHVPPAVAVGVVVDLGRGDGGLDTNCHGAHTHRVSDFVVGGASHSVSVLFGGVCVCFEGRPEILELSPSFRGL
jgi:hypothetical protein